MKILGISGYYHDSAAAIIDNGEIIAAAQEERFTRKKNDPNFPANSIRFCLDFAGITIDELDAVVYYEKPLLKFERLLETYYAFSPSGVKSFMISIPVWIKEKMFLKKLIKDELKKVEKYDKKKLKLLFPEHHLSHAASAFYPSPYKHSAILTIDGVGEWATASICEGKGNKITILKEMKFPHSLGLLYSAFTYFLGFRVNSGEYKLMGLAPYGDPNSEQVKQYVEIIKKELISLKEDGSVWLDQKYFTYATGLRMVNHKKWESLFGFKTRKPEDELQQYHCNLGLAIQKITEEAVQLMAEEAKRLTGADYLCMAGGVALNCVSNGKLFTKGIFKDIFVQPAAGDAGGALGAALAAYYISFNKDRKVDETKMDEMKGAYLGTEIHESDILKTLRKYKAVYHKFNDDIDLCKTVAEKLANGNIVGWVQGRMEFGPRALGNRSILGDPRNEEMQLKLNLKIKYRESFRPFAPSVLAERVKDFFKHDGISPYMLMVQPIQESIRKTLPENYNSLGLKEKLYHKRSDLPAITHVDFSGRIQTVHKETNLKYYTLISEFDKITGCPVVVNTSFNVRGEPIVCTPEDAYRCFMRTDMDFLALGNYFFDKNEQPEWQKNDNWKEEIILD